MTSSSRPRLFIAAVLATACAVAVSLPGAEASSPAGPSASSPAADAAKKKRCAKGKTRVRRKGRKSVCAKKCRKGFKHKVSKRGKVSCARKPKRGGSKGGGGPAAGNYTGTTAQNRPLKFTVSGGQVTGFEAGVNTYCSTQGNQRVVFDAIANVPPMAIGPDGSFSYDGPPASGNAKIRGRVTGSSATGTVGMNRGDTNYSGGQFYFGACTASDVAWSAKSG